MQILIKTDKNDIANTFNNSDVSIGQNMTRNIFFFNAYFNCYLTENSRLNFQDVNDVPS